MASVQPKHSVDGYQYKGTDPTSHKFLPGEDVYSLPPLTGEHAIDLGTYQRKLVTNADFNEQGRAYFDLGLRLLFSYQHEIAAKCFRACLRFSPHTALAHGMVSLCHTPNYNFKGRAYYESACHYEDADKPDDLCVFPSHQVADRHSKRALEMVEEIRKMHRAPKKNSKKGKGKGKGGPNNKGGQSTADEPASEHVGAKPELISDVEVQLLQAIRVYTCHPGIDPDLSEELVGRPYANACRSIYEKYPNDPEVAYFFAESLVIPNAWELYEYPSGRPLSPDVDIVRQLLERALDQHPHHAGLCHIYVHLSEMSATPRQALRACPALRSSFPHAGHLIHMPTHIDVLLGDYESCVRYNLAAVAADTHVRHASPSTAERESFYFGYIVHNYHMAVYGAILGGMEGKATAVANEMTGILTEEMFEELPDLTSYLESYSALDVHVLVRFGRWSEILELKQPKDKKLMLYRATSLAFARSLAFAATGRISEAKKESERLDGMRGDKEAHFRILHNNSVAQLLAVESAMLKGEIAYHEGLHEKSFQLLRKAVDLQDNLNYDEPWGVMQPIRHALGGLLLEQGNIQEAEQVFRRDLVLHPKNPWALVGLIECLKKAKPADVSDNGDGSREKSCCSPTSSPSSSAVKMEIENLQEQLRVQQECTWADFHVVVACECCKHPGKK
ncbi:hypothetical protein ACA910_009255 [Epithemia clementina (nom. ined.)]